MKACLSHNMAEFKTDCPPGFHLYAGDLSLKTCKFEIVATDFMCKILGVSVAFWTASP